MAFLEYNPTQTLHQYCSLEGFRGIMASKAIWCTDLEAGNDPRELALGFEHFVSAIEFVQKNEHLDDAGRFFNHIAGDIVAGHSRQQAFCACFTSVPDALPMWREYGDNLRGVSIGFRPTAVKCMPGRIQKVKYLYPDTPQEFRQLVRDLASNFDPVHSQDDISYWAVASSSILAAATALKHHSWDYEKEIRFVYAQVRLDPGTSVPISQQDDGTPIFWEKPLTRHRGGNNVNYKSIPFGLRRNKQIDPSRSIARIILGPHCAASIADIEAELHINKFDDVAVVKSNCQIR